MREIISLVSENETLDARENIVRCIDQIRNLQRQAKSYIDDEYLEYLPHLGGNQLYLAESARLCAEAESLLQNASNETKTDILAASSDLNELVLELEEVTLGLRCTKKILQIDEHFNGIDAANANEEYMRVREHITDIELLLDDPADSAVLRRLDCYASVKQKFHAESSHLLGNLRAQFEALVELAERKYQKTKAVTVRITRDENQLHDTVIALMQSRYDPYPMCEFLLANVLAPIVRQPVALQLLDDAHSDADRVTLKLSYGLTPADDEGGADLRPNYSVVLANLQQAFQCLGYMNISLPDGGCVLGIVAAQIRKRFVALLLDECLMRAVPSTMDEMSESTLVKDVLDFNRFLCDMLFLDETRDGELTAFAATVDVLFKERFCTNIVENAVAIMRQDLHDMVLVGEDVNAAAAAAADGLPTAGTFPRCMVSKSTKELTNLMDKVIRQNATSKGELTEGLLSTIPAIVDRYLTETPVYHSKLLHSIPQQTALFHNNCQYLAHWLFVNAGRAYGDTEALPAGDAAATATASDFVCWTQPLRQCGTSQFGVQIAHQHGQLLQILRDFNIPKCATELDARNAKLVRQCLRQLDLLKNVWQTILPADVYNRTMAGTLNVLCTELIGHVLRLDDIPATVCSGLVEILDDVARRAPACFADELQVSVLCGSWTKMQQLRMMLDAPLAHIAEQWAEGMGPLTLHYRAEEVKHLIRALFQNTDRRANALAKII